MNNIEMYFTIDRIYQIYSDFCKEDLLSLSHFPHLGVAPTNGDGDIVLEEKINLFRVYILNKGLEKDVYETCDIEDAINNLANRYYVNGLISDPFKMINIFRKNLLLDEVKKSR